MGNKLNQNKIIIKNERLIFKVINGWRAEIRTHGEKEMASQHLWEKQRRYFNFLFFLFL